jgi:RimJ/RimL family protein N-acetyltransferase
MPFIQTDHPQTIRPLFPTPQLGYMMDAISAGNSPGRVWLDDEKMPTSAFIWDKAHSLYFGGEADRPEFNDGLRHLLVNNLLPEAQERRLRILKFYTASDAWASRIPALVEPLPIETRGRTLFVVDSSTDREIFQPQTPLEFHLRLIDRELLGRSANAHYVIEEIESCWTSLERFLAHGFGVAALTDAGEIACWCTAEYVCGSTCGAGIETLEPYQNRGLAAAAAQAFVRHAIHRTVYWDSWQSNLPSVKVAEKVGFHKVVDYTVQLGWLNQ